MTGKSRRAPGPAILPVHTHFPVIALRRAASRLTAYRDSGSYGT
jgi:hypothetical protein